VAVFKSRGYKPNSDDWGTVDELDAHYAQTCEYVRSSITLMWRDKRWPMLDRPPILRWRRNRIVLMGDAAHAMLQYIAQGACQAIEDAQALADCIARTPADIPAALAAYERARTRRTARVQLTARAMGAFFHMQGVPAQVRNSLMRTRAPDDYSMLDWLYGYRV
jgi:salicylate hydroxylase